MFEHFSIIRYLGQNLFQQYMVILYSFEQTIASEQLRINNKQIFKKFCSMSGVNRIVLKKYKYFVVKRCLIISVYLICDNLRYHDFHNVDICKLLQKRNFCIII